MALGKSNRGKKEILRELEELAFRGSLGIKYPFANRVGVLANVVQKI
jgi:hypothetical protein